MHEEYAANPALDDFTHVDAFTLNVERACQACTDLAMHIIATKHLGVPQSSGDAFSLLKNAGIISAELEKSMRRIVGFRNIAVHQYQELNLEVLHLIARHSSEDLINFCQALGLKITP